MGACKGGGGVVAVGGRGWVGSDGEGSDISIIIISSG